MDTADEKYDIAGSLDAQLVTLQHGDPCPKCGASLKSEEGTEGTWYLYCPKDGFNTL